MTVSRVLATRARQPVVLRSRTTPICSPKGFGHRVQRLKRRITLLVFDMNKGPYRNPAHPCKLSLVQTGDLDTQAPDRRADADHALGKLVLNGLNQQCTDVKAEGHFSP